MIFWDDIWLWLISILSIVLSYVLRWFQMSYGFMLQWEWCEKHETFKIA
jgi:hypothetical protein